MNKKNWLWIAFWVGFAVFDYSLDRVDESWTFSGRLERWFRVDTAAGRARFTAALVAAAAIFWKHICKGSVKHASR